MGGGASAVNHHEQGDVVGANFVGVEIYLTLPHESTDGRNFRHTRNGFELKAEIPILKAAQFRKAMAVRTVNDGIFIDPARSGSVGADHRGNVFWKNSLELLDVFE